jgi:hypothetical protein
MRLHVLEPDACRRQRHKAATVTILKVYKINSKPLKLAQSEVLEVILSRSSFNRQPLLVASYADAFNIITTRRTERRFDLECI